MEVSTHENENREGAELYRVTIHFDDGRHPMELLAEEFGIGLEEKGPEIGLRKCGYTMPGGERASLYLDPDKIAAILPVPVGRKERERQPRDSDAVVSRRSSRSNRRETTVVRKSEEPVSGAQTEQPEPSPNRRSVNTMRRSWPPLDNALDSSPGVPRSLDLEREVLKFLARFVAVEAGQLSNAYEIQKRLFERGLYSLAVEHFFHSEDKVREQLWAMEREGLIETSKYYTYDPSDYDPSKPAYEATRKGEELARMEILPPISSTYNAHGPNYYTKMADLSQRILASLRGEAEWITGRELLSEEVRTIRERNLGRSLPAAVPGAHKAWPATPEGLVFIKDSGIVAAVGLELTHVSNRRLAAYETILDSYSMDPTIDRAYLFFAHEHAMQRVEELSRHYRQDDFFVFREYEAGGPVELSG